MLSDRRNWVYILAVSSLDQCKSGSVAVSVPIGELSIFRQSSVEGSVFNETIWQIVTVNKDTEDLVRFDVPRSSSSSSRTFHTVWPAKYPINEHSFVHLKKLKGTAIFFLSFSLFHLFHYLLPYSYERTYWGRWCVVCPDDITKKAGPSGSQL